jgi:IS30 family transposase
LELQYRSGYQSTTVQQTADTKLARCRKLIRLDSLRTDVIYQLAAERTPEQVARRLGHDGQRVWMSRETIYTDVYSSEGQSEQRARYQSNRRKNRLPRYRLGFFVG